MSRDELLVRDAAAPPKGQSKPVSPAELTKRRTKIAVVIGTLDVGGAELDIVGNFPRLSRDEFEVVVVCFQNPGPLAVELEQRGVRIVARGVGFPDAKAPSVVRLIKKAVYTIGVVRWIGRTLKAEQVDIAHFFLPHSYGYGMLACLLTRSRAKRVMSRLSLNFYAQEHRILSILEKHVLHRRLDIAIGNSKLIVEELAEEGVEPDKLRLLYNGIDVERFTRGAGDRERAREALGLARDAYVMVAVGNLWKHKGHRDLIDACALAQDALPSDWCLLIAGRDEEDNRAAYERLIAEHHLGGQVTLLGESDDVRMLLWAADVFIQPSHHEGFPNAVLEAMAASLPVIGTRVGGIPEAVSQDTGWLLETKNTSSLAATLLEAACDPAQRERKGEQGRARVVADFSLRQSVSAYESIYRALTLPVSAPHRAYRL